MHRSNVYKLGLPFRLTDSRTLKMDWFFGPKLPPPPPKRDWLSGLTEEIPMFGNSSYGDCTIASAACGIGVWTFNASCVAQWPDEHDVLHDYFNLTGGDDNGLPELTVLKYWRKTGIAGHKIAAFGTVNHKDGLLMRQAIETFGGLKLDLYLPDDWEDQLPSGVWDVQKKAPDPQNGHSVWCTGYPDDRGIWIDTWTKRVLLTPTFIQEAVTDAYAVVSPDWLKPDGKAPSGFDIEGLRKALASVD